MRRAWMLIPMFVIVFFFENARASEVYHTVQQDGRARGYWVYMPEGAVSSKMLPAVIALHGGGTNGKSMVRFSGLNEEAVKSGFIAVYPDGSGHLEKVLTWNAGTCCGYAQIRNIDDVSFIGLVIDDLEKRYNIQRSRIYLTGMSNGAMMAYRVAAEAPHLIAAVAAVSGTLEIDAAKIKRMIPVLHFHGTEDEYVPINGGRGPKSATGISWNSVENTIKAWVKVNHARPGPEITELPDRDGDGIRVIRYTYPAERDGAEVILYKIVGGGHTWPGRPAMEAVLGKSAADIDANRIMWEFFRTKHKH